MNAPQLRRHLIEAFHIALRLDTQDDDGDAQNETANRAFRLAKEHGWDYEEDDEFLGWALKGTNEEILGEALARALRWCRVSTVETCEHLVHASSACHYCSPEVEDDNGLWQTVKAAIDILVGQRVDNAHDIRVADITEPEVLGYIITRLAHDQDGIDLVRMAMEYSPPDEGHDWGWEASLDQLDLDFLPHSVVRMAVDYCRVMRDVVYSPG
jgi:hypothetical protein